MAVLFQGEVFTAEKDWVVRFDLVEKGQDKYELQYNLLMEEKDKSITSRAKSEIIIHKSMNREEQISLALSILAPVVRKKLWKDDRHEYVNPEIERQLREKWPK